MSCLGIIILWAAFIYLLYSIHFHHVEKIVVFRVLCICLQFWNKLCCYLLLLWLLRIFFCFICKASSLLKLNIKAIILNFYDLYITPFSGCVWIFMIHDPRKINSSKVIFIMQGREGDLHVVNGNYLSYVSFQYSRRSRITDFRTFFVYDAWIWKRFKGNIDRIYFVTFLKSYSFF